MRLSYSNLVHRYGAGETMINVGIPNGYDAIRLPTLNCYLGSMPAGMTRKFLDRPHPADLQCSGRTARQWAMLQPREMFVRCHTCMDRRGLKKMVSVQGTKICKRCAFTGEAGGQSEGE